MFVRGFFFFFFVFLIFFFVPLFLLVCIDYIGVERVRGVWGEKGVKRINMENVNGRARERTERVWE